MCEKLIAAGADFNHADIDGMTPLMFATDEESAEGTKLLLQAGANPNLRNEHGQTALMTAAHHGDLYTAVALLEAGANPELTDNHGKTAYDFACLEVQPSGYRFASDADYALIRGRIQTARLLVEATARYKAMKEKK
jgi:ankyrin repeat protein